MKTNDKSSQAEIYCCMKEEKWMKANDKSEEAEINHLSETEKY
jgi:hypothetical protein